MRDVGVVIGSCWLVCWLVSKVVRRCIRGEEAATFLLFAMYGTFWCGGRWYETFIHKCLSYLPFLSQHRWLRLSIPALLLLAAFLWLFLRKAKKWLPNINQACAVFCWFLVGIFLFRTGVDAVVVHGKQKEVRAAHPKSHLPNIYHILLDAHPNQKAMELLGGDLRPFYRELESLGFMTFPESMSNYSATTSSVSSMFDMGYLTGEEKKWLNERVFSETIRKRAVWKTLEPYYSFRLGGSHIINLVHYHKQFQENRVQTYKLGTVFHTALENTSLRAVRNWRYQYLLAKMDQQEILDVLSGMPALKQQFGPSGNFFYYHIRCPHPPLVFLANNKEDLILCSSYLNFIERMIIDPKALYLFRNQTEGIDQAILPVLKTILAQYQNEPIKPIILLHSDHSIFGTFMNFHPNIKRKHLTLDTTYGNLLAIYMPDSWKKDAQNLTFINLYRFILNHLLGTNIPYIKDNKQVGYED